MENRGATKLILTSVSDIVARASRQQSLVVLLPANTTHLIAILAFSATIIHVNPHQSETISPLA